VPSVKVALGDGAVVKRRGFGVVTEFVAVITEEVVTTGFDVVVVEVVAGLTTSIVPALPSVPWASVNVPAKVPLVMVVVTVAADGNSTTTVPLVVPSANIVDVVAVAPAESHVVVVWVPSGITTSIVCACESVAVPIVIVDAVLPLVMVVDNVPADGFSTRIVPLVVPSAEITAVVAVAPAGT
jgi:hypothetical protein